MGIKKVLIDGDIVAYRAAFSAKDLGPRDAEDKVDELLQFILSQTLVFPTKKDYQVYLTGKGNFRFDIAKSFEYKGNRKGTDKPVWLSHVRDYMVEEWGAIVSDGEEADDLIAIEATKIGSDAIVASIDKDMLQIPCNHFNFSKNVFTTVSEFDGLKFFYSQILTGDRADNIIGLYRVGAVKAAKLLEDCDTEDTLWEAVLKAYDGDYDRVVENARLLWLRRQENEIWRPPKEREE